MTKWKTRNLIIALVLLFFYPFVFDWLVNSEFRQRNARNDYLVRSYECIPGNNCQADFNGDGKNEVVKVIDCSSSRLEWCVNVSVNGRDIFKRPFVHAHNILRTHVAVSRESESPHLLIYDKASRIQTVGAFAWDGNELSEIQPTAFDKEILDAIASRDDISGWQEREFRIAKISFGFIGYYTFYVIMITWIFYKRSQLNLP